MLSFLFALHWASFGSRSLAPHVMEDLVPTKKCKFSPRVKTGTAGIYRAGRNDYLLYSENIYVGNGFGKTAATVT
eukprot:3223466-Amphidinium_carterae.1